MDNDPRRLSSIAFANLQFGNTTPAAETEPPELPTNVLIPTLVIAMTDLAKREEIASHWRAEGYDVTCVGTGLLVLDCIFDAVLHENFVNTRPDLMIMDVRLPGVLGSAIAKGLRDLGWNTPIILLSESGDSEDSWTLCLPSTSTADALWTASKALLDHYASIVASSPSLLAASPEPEALGVVNFRWNAKSDELQMLSPVHLGSIWAGSIAQWLANVHPKDRPQLSNHFHWLASVHGTRVSSEFRWRARTGRYRWVELRAHKNGDALVAGALVDINRHKRNALRLERLTQQGAAARPKKRTKPDVC